MDSKPVHIPVMAAEVIAGLDPRAGGLYLDGTLGLGGHAGAILAQAPNSQLCGLDRDSEALCIAKTNLSSFGDRCHFFHLPFSKFAEALAELDWRQIDGALLDLGLSSLQLDSPERGFSFKENGPLDMRMDQTSCLEGAKKLINRGTRAELRDCLATLGEEPQAGKIAARIIEERQKQPIEDTARLADIIWRAYPPAWRRSARRHPATRAFQAFRMAVNDELGELERFLSQIPDWLAPKGRLVIISFHSLEDRMVKRAMRAWATSRDDIKILAKKPLVPTQEEINANPRASSAKVRIAEKI